MDRNQVTIWMARDENGKLAVYDSKPDKYEKMKVWMPHGRYDNYIHVSPDLFPSVKWEDVEPTEVVLTLKNRV